MVVRGNHDAAVVTPGADTMHRVAEEAIVWTRARLDERHRALLASLPLLVRRGDLVFVHSSAERPADWTYVTDPVHASASLRAAGTRYVFSGHVHEPILYYTALADRPVAFKPVPGVAIPVPPRRQWLAIVGSAGQPRDGNTAACYAMLDLEAERLTFQRVPYDWSTTAAKIRAVGLPERLAHRLERGSELGRARSRHRRGRLRRRGAGPRGRDGRALPRQRAGRRLPAHHEGAAARPGGAGVERHLVRDRADGAGGAPRPARAALRDLARGRRAAVHRHGVRPGPLARRVGGARATSCGGGGAARRRGGDGAARASPPGRDPPRREALERHDPAGRRGGPHRLRARHHGHYPDLLAEEVRRPVGSAPYIAPEQVLGVRCDPRSDIFALGAVLYELATGELPFGAPSSQATLRRRLWRDPVPPRAIARDVPEWLQHVILRCLEVDAGVRYPTAAQVAFDLSHPAEVTAGERGLRTRRAGPWQVLKKWVKAIGFEPAPCPQPSVYIAGASIVLAAVATAHSDAAQAEAIREAVGRVVAAGGHVRLACVTVVPPSSDLGGSAPHDTATSQRLRHRVLLRHWAEPLKPRARRSPSTCSRRTTRQRRCSSTRERTRWTTSSSARRRTTSGCTGCSARSRRASRPTRRRSRAQLLRRLGTVSMKVAAEAPCTVTLVRAAAAGA